MSAPPTVLSQTLQSITVTKIRELKKQRTAFESQKNKWLSKIEDVSHDQREKIRQLLLALEELDPQASKTESVSSISRWLEQSEFDSSVSSDRLTDFEEQLRAKVDIQSRRLGLADLYSTLLTEWLKSSASEATEAAVQENTKLDDSFEIVEKDRLQQLTAKFEAVVFKPLETDEVEIDVYLADLFSGDAEPKATKRVNPDRLTALDRIRRDVRSHGELKLKILAPFDQISLKWCIKGLLKEDLLRDDKKVVLTDFLKDDVALGEIKDVLNMKYNDLNNWSWDACDEGMPVEPRRQLNGKYRIMMDEDVLQAIFLQYIGVEWCVSMKAILKDTMTWTTLWNKSAHLSQDEIDKRQYYLGSYASQEEARGGVDRERQSTYMDDFFLSQLPSTVHQAAGGYDGDDDDDDDDDDRKDPDLQPAKAIKQQLLRQLATEVHLRQALDGEVAVVQSDMQWFATSLPHSTIVAVFRFLGMPETWLTFFKKFLEAPLNMGPSSGDSTSPVRIRKRGVPMAHVLEKLFGEMVLFIMDLAVNQEAHMLLYRLHDDLWLCGKPEDCAKAWISMEQFTAVMGLEFNKSKTGSVYLTSHSHGPKHEKIWNALPRGPVSVGFLTLDPENGNWVINQEQVSAHMQQLQKQLSACKSILSWVQTWNSCIGRFFSHTFGEPANCFGRPHVNSILETHQRIQQFLFDGMNATSHDVKTHLKYLIKERFGVSDLPDAFIFLPEQLGGLGVTNPFIPLFLVRNSLYADPASRMKKFLEQEKKMYEDYREDFEKRDESELRRRFKTVYSKHDIHFSERDESFDLFMSFRQYVMYRESTSPLLKEAYSDLMRLPQQNELKRSPAFTNPFSEFGTLVKGQQKASLEKLDEKQMWILQFYAEELFEKCGGLSLVDKTLLPLGVLTMLRKRKVTWQMVL